MSMPLAAYIAHNAKVERIHIAFEYYVAGSGVHYEAFTVRKSPKPVISDLQRFVIRACERSVSAAKNEADRKSDARERSGAGADRSGSGIF